MSGFFLDGEEYYLEYEGLHLLCTSCGVYGHRNENCSLKKKTAETEIGNPNEDDAVQKEQGMNNSSIIQEQWKVVQKPRRQRKSKEKQGEPSRQGKGGSRFDILADVEEPNTGINEVNNIIRDESNSMVPLRAHSEQQRKVQIQTEKGERDGHANKQFSTNGSTKEVGQRAQQEPVQQGSSSRRVEKRTREATECDWRNKGEVLMITMGEGTDRVEDERFDCDGATMGDHIVAAQTQELSEDVDFSSLPMDPGENRIEEVEPGDVRTEMCIESPIHCEPSLWTESVDIVVPETQMASGL